MALPPCLKKPRRFPLVGGWLHLSDSYNGGALQTLSFAFTGIRETRDAGSPVYEKATSRVGE
jgi:hypothetical protein